MTPGAQNAEELEALFEDAFVLRDQAAAACLFEHSGVLASAAGPRIAHGRTAIAALVERLWAADEIYVTDPRQVLQAGDITLVIGSRAINIARRGPGGWRYAIALLDCDGVYDRKEEP